MPTQVFVSGDKSELHIYISSVVALSRQLSIFSIFKYCLLSNLFKVRKLRTSFFWTPSIWREYQLTAKYLQCQVLHLNPRNVCILTSPFASGVLLAFGEKKEMSPLLAILSKLWNQYYKSVCRILQKEIELSLVCSQWDSITSSLLQKN